jgi:hypothetical protein
MSNPPKFSVHVIPDTILEQTRHESVHCLLAFASELEKSSHVDENSMETWRDNVSKLRVISNPIELCAELCECIKALQLNLLGPTLDKPVPDIGSVPTNKILPWIQSRVETGLSDESMKIIGEIGFWSDIPLKCIEIHKKYPKNHIAMLFCIGALNELKRTRVADELLEKVSNVENLGDLERGMMFYVSKQYELALKTLVPLKNPLAYILVGRMFCYGQGTKVDFTEAVKWFRLAADQGFAGAQSNIGFCYDNGTGVIKDEKEAVKWYRLAADQGYAIAQFNLGVCYQYGTGVIKDEKEAVKLYRLAANQGEENAMSALERLESIE